MSFWILVQGAKETKLHVINGFKVIETDMRFELIGAYEAEEVTLRIFTSQEDALGELNNITNKIKRGEGGVFEIKENTSLPSFLTF